MAEHPSSSSSSAALSSGTLPASLSSMALDAATPASATSAPTSPPLHLGSNPFLPHGTTPSSGSQFTPIFTSAPPAPAPPAPRHPIFSDHITNHIKFLLNPVDHNYHKWKSFFLMVLIYYGVLFLVEHAPPPNDDASCHELDAHVILWIDATLADPMVDHVVGATSTFATGKKIKDFFLANRVVRFMVLNRQYRNLKQGDIFVSEYARRMKLLTDGLVDIDHAVTENDFTT
ncbi:hypothetical protein D1007_39180 [Hordeum vulgare]|nr:hypothetical protein D1007_39180 [Hordeum vulgare]